jgi:hypothetical protein
MKGLVSFTEAIKGPNGMLLIRGSAHLCRLILQSAPQKKHLLLLYLSPSTSMALYIQVTHHTPRAGCACDLRLGLGEVR